MVLFPSLYTSAFWFGWGFFNHFSFLVELSLLLLIEQQDIINRTSCQRKYQTYIERAHTHCTHVPEVLETHVWQDANRRGAMKSGSIHASGGGGGGQERLWCLAIFRSPFLAGQQQLKPDKHMHKHTSVRMNACTHPCTHQLHTYMELSGVENVTSVWTPAWGE